MRAARAPNPRAGRLPSDLTEFVGRRSELARIRGALDGARLVTLSGPGGIGKTRLALRAASDVRRVFRDGVWLVELAGLRDPALLATEVARSMGLLDQSARWAVATLSDHLADRHALLVLDNCEQLVDACAVLTEALLRACPQLHVIATSRQVLGVAGEVTFAVPPMSVPEDGELTSPEGLLRYEAIQLFVDRGTAVLPDFALDARNGPAVAGLCRRLDGIPLAIELAAVRLRALSPEQLLARLHDRFALLASGGPSADARHQTLLATVDWSYDLLTEAEQALWRRVSVFAGTFDLDAAEAVCADSSMAVETIVDQIDGLVAKSILRRSAGGGKARYRLLDTTREYGQQKLSGEGRGRLLRIRHRDWYAALAAQQEALGPRQVEWIDGLDSDHENLRAALEFCLAEPAEVPAGLRMACDLWLYWETRGHLLEGRRLLDALLANGAQRASLHARGLWTAGYLALVQGDAQAATELLEAALQAGQEHDDPPTVAYASQFLGRAVWFLGDPARGFVLTQDALARHKAAADWHGIVLTLVQLGVMLALTGDPAAAVTPFTDCAAMCEARGERWNRSYALWGLGLATWLLGDTVRANELEQEALRAKRDVRDQVGIALCIEALAWIAGSQRDPARAVRLLGAAEAAWESIPAALPAPLRRHRDAAMTAARSTLSEASCRANYAKGRALSLPGAVSAALGEPAPAPAAGHQPTRLTSRERQVAGLVARGLSNRDIAGTLVISPRTAETHVQHIMDKLGCTARAQIAAWSAGPEGSASPRGPLRRSS